MLGEFNAGRRRPSTAVRRGIQHALVTWMPRFKAAYGPEVRAVPGAEDLATYIEGFHALTGSEAERRMSGGIATVMVRKSLSEFVGGSLTAVEHGRTARVLSESWNALAAHLGHAVSADPTGRVWTVRART